MDAFSAPAANILLLDSEAVMRAALRDALKSAGYLVATASDLGEAVERLAEMRPDLLITRPFINSMPGRTAAEYLRSKQNGLPILIVAGFMDDDRVRVQTDVDALYTFPEPYSRDELIAKVRNVLDSVRKKT
jgi:DNA-binding response OmpR family regulator